MRATSRIALSVLGVGALGAGAVAMTGSGGGTPRCAGYTYPTLEACQTRHTGSSVCSQNPTTGLWSPDSCGTTSTGHGVHGTTTGMGPHTSTGSGWWWWSGGRRGTTTSTPRTTTSTPTVVGRSSSGSRSPTTTSSPRSTSSRGGFGSTGRSSSGG